MNPFVHLRVHSDYSLSEGASGVEDLIAEAKRLKMPALALTDRDALFGAWLFSTKCAKEGIQPLIGCKLHVTIDKRRYSLTFIAQNEAGYINLCSLAKAACWPRDNGKGKQEPPPEPDLPFDAIDLHSDNLIVLSGGGTDGLLPGLAAQDPDRARQAYQWLLGRFQDRLYVEICRSGAPGERGSAVETILLDLAYGIGVEQLPGADGIVRHEAPIVATSDVWYATPDRHEGWMILGAISRKEQVTIDHGRIVGGKGTHHHLRSAEEMSTLFADLPEALRNTSEVARRCTFHVRDRKPILPPFACAGGRSEAEEMRHQAEAGLEVRLDKKAVLEDQRTIYRDRLAFELDVIEKMGFPGYFLIVADFIKWAKANDIPVGPGRGSGAGSVVAWSLTITDLDPLEYGLLFERFLNPDRVSMPDFDIDFCQDRRGEVIAYVKRRYGADLVSAIASFQEIKTKTALKDAGRVIIDEQLGIVGFGELNELTKTIPNNPAAAPKSLRDAYENLPLFRERVDTQPKLKSLLHFAKSIEGLYRGVGTHAAGVIIGSRPLEQLVPVHWSAMESMMVCSYDMKGAEATGQVKFDFLGLTTLSIMRLAVSYIQDTTGQTIDLAAIPKNDAATYDMIARGRTLGVFQMESAGMTDAIRNIAPTRLEDLIAIVALYRPGPMDQIPSYAARKRGEPWDAPYPTIRAVLEETYGIMVYQEQVMTIAQQMAGYTLGAADLLRRAMGKKIREEMDQQRDIFVSGCIRNGIDNSKAVEVFDLMAKFADYGFNKSHAAAYAWLAYQTAWLKTHYPAEFLSAYMTYTANDAAKLSAIKYELEKFGIPLLPPDINHSKTKFSPETCSESRIGKAVRFGMIAIKGLSGNLDRLESEQQKGPFRSLTDFHRRAGAGFNTKQMEGMAAAGCFDGISNNRAQAAQVLGWLVSRKAADTSSDLFGGAAPVVVPTKISDVGEWGDVTDREYKVLGFYVGEHPIDRYSKRLNIAGIRRRSSFRDYMLDEGIANLEGRKLCVMVDDVKMAQTRTGNAYLRVDLSEQSDSYDAAFFASFRPRSGELSIEEMRNLLEAAKTTRKPVVIVCKLALDGDNVRVNGRDVWDVDKFLAAIGRPVRITIDPTASLDAKLAEQMHRDAIHPGGGENRLRMLFQKRVATIKGWLEKSCGESEDGDSDGASVTITSDDDTITLPSLYKLDSTMFAVLQGMDGVIDVTEDPDDEEPSTDDELPEMAACF